MAPFTFVQLSDSHVGFSKPANPDALGTLREAIPKIKALPQKPAFILHTGDITHLSKDEEFDNADQIIKEACIPVFFVPSEHDVIDDGRGKAYLTRYGKKSGFSETCLSEGQSQFIVIPEPAEGRYPGFSGRV